MWSMVLKEYVGIARSSVMTAGVEMREEAVGTRLRKK